MSQKDSGGLKRQKPTPNNHARAVFSFVDAHVSYIPVYWNGVKGFDGISAFCVLGKQKMYGLSALAFILHFAMLLVWGGAVLFGSVTIDHDT
jgi:hypothetical protein